MLVLGGSSDRIAEIFESPPSRRARLPHETRPSSHGTVGRAEVMDKQHLQDLTVRMMSQFLLHTEVVSKLMNLTCKFRLLIHLHMVRKNLNDNNCITFLSLLEASSLLSQWHIQIVYSNSISFGC
jgi:hypothetical protein